MCVNVAWRYNLGPSVYLRYLEPQWNVWLVSGMSKPLFINPALFECPVVELLYKFPLRHVTMLITRHIWSNQSRCFTYLLARNSVMFVFLKNVAPNVSRSFLHFDVWGGSSRNWTANAHKPSADWGCYGVDYGVDSFELSRIHRNSEEGAAKVGWRISDLP